MKLTSNQLVQLQDVAKWLSASHITLAQARALEAKGLVRVRMLKGPRPWSARPTAAGLAIVRQHAPIMDECQECNGTGEVQQVCEECDVSLTEHNLASGAEGYICKTCFAKENS